MGFLKGKSGELEFTLSKLAEYTLECRRPPPCSILNHQPGAVRRWIEFRTPRIDDPRSLAKVSAEGQATNDAAFRYRDSNSQAIRKSHCR